MQHLRDMHSLQTWMWLQMISSLLSMLRLPPSRRMCSFKWLFRPLCRLQMPDKLWAIQEIKTQSIQEQTMAKLTSETEEVLLKTAHRCKLANLIKQRCPRLGLLAKRWYSEHYLLYIDTSKIVPLLIEENSKDAIISVLISLSVLLSLAISFSFHRISLGFHLLLLLYEWRFLLLQSYSATG